MNKRIQILTASTVLVLAGIAAGCQLPGPIGGVCDGNVCVTGTLPPHPPRH